MSKNTASALVGAGSKDECPFCLERVQDTDRSNCMTCMTCKQKMHGICNTAPPGPYNPDVLDEQPGLYKWNMDKSKAKGDARLLKDDILMCPVCNGDSIAYCYRPTNDINDFIKEAVAENPMAKGGRRLRRQRKTRKTRKMRKTRKIRKTNRRMQSKKSKLRRRM